jgi:hypothetical protein
MILARCPTPQGLRVVFQIRCIYDDVLSDHIHCVTPSYGHLRGTRDCGASTCADAAIASADFISVATLAVTTL